MPCSGLERDEMSRQIIIKCTCGAHIAFVRKPWWQLWRHADFTTVPCPWCFKEALRLSKKNQRALEDLGEVFYAILRASRNVLNDITRSRQGPGPDKRLKELRVALDLAREAPKPLDLLQVRQATLCSQLATCKIVGEMRDGKPWKPFDSEDHRITLEKYIREARRLIKAEA